MVFLYIAAAVCLALCAAQLALCIRALHVFRKWRGSVQMSFTALQTSVVAEHERARKRTLERFSDATARRGLVDMTPEELLCAIYVDGDAGRERQAEKIKVHVDGVGKKITRCVEVAVRDAVEKIAAQSTHDAEENGKKRDLIDEFFGVFNYSLDDALRAAQAGRGTEDDSE